MAFVVHGEHASVQASGWTSSRAQRHREYVTPGPGHCAVGASCRCSRCRCSRRTAIRLRAGRRPGRVQHEPPLAARAAARGPAGPLLGGAGPMLLCADAEATSADLASGALACPSCGTGAAAAVGHGREREIRMRGGRVMACWPVSWSRPSRRYSACGFQNSATAPDLASYAARSYSLMRPPRAARRWIRALERSAVG
jgi:hypothetical protein